MTRHKPFILSKFLFGSIFTALSIILPNASFAQTIEQDTARANSYNAQAWNYERNFMLSEAYQLYKKSNEIYRKYSLWDNYVENFRGLIVIEAFRGNMDKGRALMVQADSLVNEYKIQKLVSLTKLLEGKTLFYIVNGMPDSTIFFANQSLGLYRSGGHMEKEEVARIYNGIGGAYNEQDRFDLAIQYYDSATAIIEATEGLESSFASTIFYNKAETYRKSGNYEKALEYDFRSLNISSKYLDPNHVYLATSYLGIGQDYLGNAEGENNIQLALGYFDRCKKILEVNPDVNYQSHLNASYGEAYRLLKEYKKSEEYYLKAIQIVEELFEEQHPELIAYYHTLIDTYLGLNKPDSAYVYLKKAKKLIEGGNGKFARALANNLLFEVKLIKAGQPIADTIGYLFQDALTALTPDFTPKDIFENPKVDKIPTDNTVLKILNQKAAYLKLVFEETGDLQNLKAALDSYLLASEYIKLARKGMANLRYKLTFNELNDDLYEKAIRIALQLYEQEKKEEYLVQAIKMVENRKSSLLVDQLADIEAQSFANIPDTLLARSKRLKSDIDFNRRLLFEQYAFPISQKNTGLIDELNTTIFNLEYEREQLIKKLEYEYPSYYQIKHNPEKIEITELKNNLQPNQAIVEYFWGEDSLYSFVIGQNGVDYSIMENNVALEINVNQFLSALKSSNIDAYTEFGYEVYKKLFNPKMDEMLQSIDYLCIIPDGILSYIPFETLISEIPSGKVSYKKLSYLLEEYTFSYHYSATLLAKMLNDQKEKKWENSFVGFAPSFSQERTAQLRGTIDDSIQISQLLSLPQAQAEVKHISEIFGGDIFIGKNASENTFKTVANNNKVIHLATHTLINDQNPLYSKLVFTPNADQEEDGLLHTYELYNMQLNAQMVSLSACNTGIGRYLKGEGIVSLARGFMYAGVPNVMMSYWAVPDQSTSMIMQGFYEEMKKGESRAVALRNAKLTYLKNADAITANPYFWGAFVYLGEVEEAKPMLYTFLWLLIIPFAVFIWLLFKKKAIR